MQSNRIASVANATTEGDALNYHAWTSWTPSVSYVTAAWGSPTITGVYQQTGKTMYFYFYARTSDNNGGKVAGFTLPKSSNSGYVIPFSTFCQYNNVYTYCPASAYVPSAVNYANISYQAYTPTDGQASDMFVEGFYPVA